MAKARKCPTTTETQCPADSINPRKDQVCKGWKYKPLKVGPLTLPRYASPESQLILVSFVCFLCPGKAMKMSSLLKPLTA